MIEPTLLVASDVVAREALAADAVRVSELIAIPLGATRLVYGCARGELPDDRDVLVEVVLDLSYDGGKTWFVDGDLSERAGRYSFTARGGVALDRDGNVHADSFDPVPLREPQNPQRVARLTVRALKGMTTSAQVLVL